MKTRSILFSALLAVLPMCVQAQDDDLYFTPSKSDKTAKQSDLRKDAYDRPTYYCGSNRSVDEYNRRGKLKSYYQKIGTDSLGNDIIEFHEGDGMYAAADSAITIYPGSERYYDDNDSDYAYSRRMSRFDGFWCDPLWYGSYWNSPYYWRSYYGWYDPWYDPWYGPYYTGWYGGWYSPWHYGYYGWNSPYWGWSGWYTPGVHVSYGGPTGTRNHSTIGGFRTGTNNRTGRTTGTNSYGNRRYSSDRLQDNNGFGNRRPAYSNNDNSTRYQQPQTPSFGNSGSFGSNRGSFGGGSGFGGSRGSFGGGGSFGGSRGGFGSRR